MTSPPSSAHARRPAGPARPAGRLEAERRRLFAYGSEVAPARRHEIHGIDHVLDRVDEVLHWLDHAGAYAAYDASLEPGILFVGPPGTGKTLVARYVATAAGATFVAVRDFPLAGRRIEAGDVRALFRLARRTRREDGRPVILFWDEIDSAVVGYGPFPPRPTDAGQQLLVELDGVHGKNDGVLLLASTNAEHELPDALRRPGRVGVTVYFDAPSYAGKAALLEHFAVSLGAAEGMDYDRLVAILPEHAPAAAVEEIAEDAWRAAVRRAIEEGSTPELRESDLHEAALDHRLGTRRSRRTPERSLRVAVHEVGHALVALAYGLPVTLLSVRPHGGRLGLVQAGAERVGQTVEELQAMLRVGFGGLAAEVEAGLGQGLGSECDLRQGTELAASLVGEHGAGTRTRGFNAGALGSTRTLSRSEPGVSEAALSLIDLDTIDVLHAARADAEAVIAGVGREALLRLGRLLVDRETLDGDEFTQAVRGLTGDAMSPP